MEKPHENALISSNFNENIFPPYQILTTEWKYPEDLPPQTDEKPRPIAVPISDLEGVD